METQTLRSNLPEISLKILICSCKGTCIDRRAYGTSSYTCKGKCERACIGGCSITSNSARSSSVCHEAQSRIYKVLAYLVNRLRPYSAVETLAIHVNTPSSPSPHIPHFTQYVSNLAILLLVLFFISFDLGRNFFVILGSIHSSRIMMSLGRPVFHLRGRSSAPLAPVVSKRLGAPFPAERVASLWEIADSLHRMLWDGKLSVVHLPRFTVYNVLHQICAGREK